MPLTMGCPSKQRRGLGFDATFAAGREDCLPEPWTGEACYLWLSSDHSHFDQHPDKLTGVDSSLQS